MSLLSGAEDLLVSFIWRKKHLLIRDFLLYCVYCFQKDAMENSVEIVVEKLLNVTKDIVPKVTNFILFLFFFLYSCFLFPGIAIFTPFSGLK